MLIFSVTGSGHFQGYAHLAGNRPVGADQSGHNLSPAPVEWMETRHLLNICHGNRPVHLDRGRQVMLT